MNVFRCAALLVACIPGVGGCNFIGSDDEQAYPGPFLVDVGRLPPDTAARLEQIHNSAIDVPIVRLLANPRDYDDRSVKVVGVLHVGERGTVLYSSRDAYEHGIDNDAILIANTFADPAVLARFSGYYVQVIGQFDAQKAGPPFRVNGQFHDVLPIVPANVLERWRRMEDGVAAEIAAHELPSSGPVSNPNSGP